MNYDMIHENQDPGLYDVNEANEYEQTTGNMNMNGQNMNMNGQNMNMNDQMQWNGDPQEHQYQNTHSEQYLHDQGKSILKHINSNYR